MAVSKKTITISLRQGDDRLIDELADHHPLLSRHRAAELALHHGLTALDADRRQLDQAISETANQGRPR